MDWIKPSFRLHNQHSDFGNFSKTCLENYKFCSSGTFKEDSSAIHSATKEKNGIQ